MQPSRSPRGRSPSRVLPVRLADGCHRVPGDKSISHRALMLAALAPGRSRITGTLAALDTRSTARVLRQLGADITPLRDGQTVVVAGPDRFQVPGDTLHCGNSGTTARLLLGILAAQPLEARLTGDRSLRRRPMARVADPLATMGAAIRTTAGQLPLVVRGGRLRPLHWELPVASAQVKSALLLAGAAAGVEVTLTEPGPSRDHTERFLGAMGFTLRRDGARLHLAPTGRFRRFDLAVPGDPSSAAFLAAAAALGRRGLVRVAEVGCNPTRIGFLEVMARMGVPVALEPDLDAAIEPTGDLLVGPAVLEAVTVGPEEVPGLVDEIPILAMLAARARGESRFQGLAELRVKESDRLALLAENLRAVGVEAAAEGDDLVVVGTDRPLAGSVRTDGDHRIAMAFAVLDQADRIRIDDPECAAVSFPGFRAALAAVRREVA